MSTSQRFARTIRTLFVIAISMVVTLTGIVGAEATTSAFVSTWDTRTTYDGSSADNQIRLPLEPSGTYNFTVEWGDGNSDTVTAHDDAAVTHTYSSAGVYTVSITGTIIGWRFNRGGDRLKITGISSWGPLQFGNSGGYFYGAENLQVTATDAPDLTGTTDLSYAFAWATNFNNPAITTWDVSGVTKMTGMFAGHVHGVDGDKPMTFNQPIGSWNTASLTDSSWMFSGNTAFNSPIGGWDMADVTTLGGMFSGASSFNQPIDTWSTSHVTSLSSTFENATAFNQPLNSWNTSNVEVMRAAFYQATAFNQSLSSWDTSHVWHFGISFTGASSFNQSLGSWNMTSATEVDEMLNGTAMAWNTYDATLIGWSTQSVRPLRSGMTVGAGGRKYTSAAESARTTLVDTKGWPISGDALLASGVPGVTMSGANPPTTQVGSSASTTITVQSSGTAPLSITSVSLIGLGATDYTITSNSCPTGSLAELATCTLDVTFTPTRDGHRYTFVRVDSDAATSPDLYDVSAFGYGFCPAAPFAAGTGTSGDPYVITTLEQLNCVNAANASGIYLYLNTHKHFRLGADIDGGSSVESFQPIGTWYYEFNGEFDGDGHVLSNAVVHDTNAGVFPWLDGGANIHDLTIRDAQVTTLESGGILTAGAWGTTVSNVVIDGGELVATKGWQVGGLAGMFEGTMSEVSSNASVTSSANAEWASVGGLVGQLEGSLTRGLSTGSVTVSARASDTVVVGGLLGGTNATVSDSYSTASVSVTGGTADSRVAGLVGDMWGSGSVSTSYAAGAVSGATAGQKAGFVGALRESSSVSDTLWNTQTTGIATDAASSGSAGVTTTAMRSLSTYTGWDIAQAPDLTKVWVLRTGYPAQLSWTDESSPTVTPTSQTVTGTVGTAIAPTDAFTATGFLGSVSYTIVPALPAGLTIDAATGVVSGIPSSVAATGTHTITATGSVAGEDTSTISITVSGSPDPGPSPDPRPRPGPTPATPTSGGTPQTNATPPIPTAPAVNPSPASPAVAAVNTSPVLVSGSQPIYRQPALAQPVTGAVTLVPARVAATIPARMIRQEPSAMLGAAPVITATAKQPLKLLVPGLTPGANYIVQMKTGKGYVVLGTVKANADGQVQLPVFRTTKPTEATIAMVSSAGDASYIKVKAVKAGGKRPAGSNAKPGRGTATAR